MPNTETDTLGLVETFPVPAGRWFLPPAVRTDVGYSLQVFSPTGQYKGAVTAQGMHLRAREGDQVLRINLGEHYLSMSGELLTKDNFTRSYSLKATFRIDNPQAFAIEYRQKTDPIGKLKEAIAGQLKRWAEDLEHDAIDTSTLRFWAKQGATVSAKRVGVLVGAIEQATVALSEWHAKRQTIQRDEVIRQDTQEIDARVKSEQRHESALDQDAGRLQTELNTQLEIKLEAQKHITATFVDAYNDRLRRGLADGVPLATLIAEDPDLAAWVGQVAAPSPAAQIAAPNSTLSPLSRPLIDADRVTTPSQPTPPEEEIHIPLLGITCAPALLTDEQRFIAEQQRIPSILRTFIIREVDADGPGARANLAKDDIIIQMDGSHLSSIDTLSQRALSVSSGQPATIHIFRGSEIYSATLEALR